MKTSTQWRYHLRPDRTAEWTSPTGHTYTTHPGQWLPPLQPPTWLDEPTPTNPDPHRQPGEAPGDQPPWLEACGPDTHPLLGVPADSHGGLLAYQYEAACDLTDEQFAALQPPPPWAASDPQAEDPLDHDPDDWRTYATVFR